METEVLVAVILHRVVSNEGYFDTAFYQNIKSLDVLELVNNNVVLLKKEYFNSICKREQLNLIKRFEQLDFFDIKDDSTDNGFMVVMSETGLVIIDDVVEDLSR